MNEEELELIFTYDIIDLGNRIKNKRKKLDYTQEDVARMTGVSESTISRIENGKLPNPERNTIERLTRWVGEAEPRDGVVAVPYYECVIASTPSPVPSEPAGHWDLNKKLIRSHQNSFFVRVFGDSMIDANIFTDDVLIVERVKDPAEVQHNTVVVAVVNNEFCVKKYFKDGSRIELHSANDGEKERYPNILIKPTDNFQLWGRVTCLIRPYKSLFK